MDYSAQNKINTDSLINIYNSNIHDSLKLSSLIALATLYTDINNDSCLFYAEKANILSKKLKLKKQEAIALLQIGRVHEKQYELEKATLFAKNALFIDSVLKNKEGIARAYLVLAIISYEKDKYEDCITLFHKSLKLFEENGNKEQAAVAVANISSIYAQLNQLELAIEYAEKAMKYFKSNKESAGYLTALSTLIQSYKELENFDKALHYNKEMLKISEKTNNVRGIIHCYNMYGVIYESMDQFEKAINYLHKAIELSEKQNISPNAHTTAWFNIAVVYTNSGQYEKALPIYQRCLKEFETVKNMHALNQTYLAISELYVNLKRFDFAHKYLKMHNILNDSLLSEENLHQINALRIQYETEKKDEEIALLKERNKVNRLELNQKEAALKVRNYIYLSSLFIILFFVSGVFFFFQQKKLQQKKRATELEHKALRSQMNPHFIFNALNSIQRKYIEGNNDEANEFMGEFAALMRKILDNSNKNSITLHEEISTLKLYLNLEKLRCSNQFDYFIGIDEKIDTMSVKVPPLIIQPFVENAIWHGLLPKKTKGRIDISIVKTRNKLVFTIKDNGVGITTLMSKDSNSKGIQITEQRIGNKVNIDSQVNKGTTVKFYITI